MSLDIFGHVSCNSPNLGICERSLNELCGNLKITVSFDSVDEEDRKVLWREIRDQNSSGLDFAIYSETGESDATVLWLEARDLAMHLLKAEGIAPLILSPSQLRQTHIPQSYFLGIRDSRLGAFISELVNTLVSFKFGIALVDGGVEAVRWCDRNDCLQEILKSFILPWDVTENALYIFPRKPSS